MNSLRRGRAEPLAQPEHAAAQVAPNGQRADGTGQLAADAVLLQRIVDRAPIGALTLDADGVVTMSRGGMLHAPDLVPGVTVGRPLMSAHPDTVDLANTMQRALAGEEGRAVVRVGALTLDVWYGPQFDPSGCLVGAVGLATEAAGVLHDPLTGLLSRRQLLQTLERMIHDDTPPALLFCNVDRFKLINDSLGPELGDRVLAAVAARLRTTVRDRDVVARVGGDEFVVLLDRMVERDDVEQMARRILSRVIAPIVVDGRRLLTTLSIGIALPDAGDDAADLLRRADMAMSQAKHRGRERYVVHRRSADANVALRRLELQTEIRAALERDELRVQFQPIVRCDNGAVALVEALVRWQHPVRGLVGPGDFLPVAEEAGLLRAIDHWVLVEASRQVSAIVRDARDYPPVVSVNLTGLPFDEADIVARILEDTRNAGLKPQQLIIEVTENLLGVENDAVVRAFEQLRAHGVRIAVDDFGTGYSSLHRLRSLPVDLLKVDRAFVAGLGEEPEASALLDAIVTMGHALGMEIIAEGVETATQFAEVCRLGCDMAQGYHFARPAPLPELNLSAGPGSQADAG